MLFENSRLARLQCRHEIPIQQEYENVQHRSPCKQPLHANFSPVCLELKTCVKELRLTLDHLIS